jgi:hypothetical protein
VARFAGQRAQIHTHEPREGRRHFEGALLGPDAQGRAGVRTEQGTEHWFDWAEVRSARLVVDPWTGAAPEKAARRPSPRGLRHGAKRRESRA